MKWWWLPMSCCVLSCATVIGLDDYERGVGGAGGTAGGAGGIGEGGLGGTTMLDTCGTATEPAGCAEAPPLGFTGPVIVRQDESPCGGEWGAEAFAATFDLTAAPANCSCACTASNGSCDRARYDTYTDAACTDVIGGNNVAPGQCTPATVNSTFVAARAIPITTPADCTPDEAADIPDFDPQMQRVCEATETPVQDACDTGQVCVPLPDDTSWRRICVVSTEAVPCPTAYPVPFDAAVTVSDDRGCTPCACPDSAEPTCTGSVRFANGAGCIGTYATAPLDGSCIPGGIGTYSQIIAEVETDTTVCIPLAGSAMPTGSVTANDARTVCCTPELAAP